MHWSSYNLSKLQNKNDFGEKWAWCFALKKSYEQRPRKFQIRYFAEIELSDRKYRGLEKVTFGK